MREWVIREEDYAINQRIKKIPGPFHDRLGIRKFSAFGVLEDILWKSLEHASVEIVREEVPADEAE